ncbi:hypothetical protein AB0904_27950 [Streptomyces sp. NPDC006684]|uniref:hypothetical protein n=1 Tax=Streptomyces sp. NPDC006684 TaxID=3154477 RepID=UPI0034513863
MRDYLLDADGVPFEPHAVYADRHGDLWEYIGLHETFLHIKAVAEGAPAQGPGITRWVEDARAVARDFGPMVKTGGEAA